LTDRLSEVALGYQRALKQNPHNPEALVGMSLVALASRQTEAAVKMATAAVTAAPGMGSAWVTLGQALKTAGRPEDAEESYLQALCLDGMNPLARMGLAELKIATGRPEAAMRDFQVAIQREPTLVNAYLGLGHALACMGRNQEALERYNQARGLRPKLPEAEFAAGFVLARLGKYKEAEIRYRRALVQRPDFAAAWMNLGALLREQGREVHALAALERAVELRPDMIAGWINLALLARERRKPELAEKHLRKAFELDPNQVETHVAWSQFRNAEKDPVGAEGWLRWALALDPTHAEATNMQGILLHNQRRFAEAIEVFERAEALGSKAAVSNRGNSLLDMGRTTEALEAHVRAVEVDPVNPGAKYNLALTQLRLGDWKSGWQAYESRWQFREVHRSPRVFRQPRWQGEALNGRRVLLHAEQGLGDTIQFCRYAALVAARGGVPVLQVQNPVERLMHTLPVVHSGFAETAVLGSAPPAFDLECPLLSLPAVFGTTVKTVPWSGAYLGSDASLAFQRRMRSPHVRPGEKALRVGLSWAGNPRYKADHLRSTKLKTLEPLLRTHGVNWISLQKGAPAVQLKDLPGDIFVWDSASDEQDLADTAAMVSSLDLVITTDTCIAHLAGAMAKPAWVLLPHLGDWRWMQDIETTPWYPTVRLLRQPSVGDWGSVLGRVVDELHELHDACFMPPGRAPQRESLPQMLASA